MTMKIKIAKIDELKQDKLVVKTVLSYRVCILARGENVLAFEDMCSHDGESISEGELKGDCITCPRHMAEFDLKTGEALCMPATEPIRVFPVNIVGEEVEIEMEDI